MHKAPPDLLRGTVGLGFRAALAEELLACDVSAARFIEIAPENYLGVGGKRGRLLAMARERWPVVSHGLCGDFAGAAPVDDELLAAVKGFLRENHARWYSDHLCLTHVAGAETHDLLPLPFTAEAIARAARRIREVQDRLDLPIAIENVSAYLRHPEDELPEAAFVAAVVVEAGCSLLLDVNNVYVNAVNFGIDAHEYIRALPLDRVVQMHIAGHHVEQRDVDDGSPSLVIDTHGAPIIDPVFALLGFTVAEMRRRGLTPAPVLLERDHNIPPVAELELELVRLQAIVDGGPP
ncbi:MAG: DUF692 domain-containing protein [Deltaproteobacteria bacterium]|nr:DUF692 domain-containing protein [Deltaproteobacteria bacterium]